METKEYKTIDRIKAGWPSGIWDSEPDKVQWPDEATGLPCLAVRHRRWGSWCGYVGITKEHPHFGKDYSGLDIEVHGGLTFADECSPGETEAEGICHVPSAGESNHVWWFGFDCGHAWDYSPQDVARSAEGYPFTIDADASYKTLNYVKHECKKLAAQLAQNRDDLR